MLDKDFAHLDLARGLEEAVAMAAHVHEPDTAVLVADEPAGPLMGRAVEAQRTTDLVAGAVAAVASGYLQESRQRVSSHLVVVALAAHGEDMSFV